MEGASLRGPETLPPWNLVFKWSDTKRYHSLGSGSFSTLHSDHGTFAADPQSLMWRVFEHFQESFLKISKTQWKSTHHHAPAFDSPRLAQQQPEGFRVGDVLLFEDPPGKAVFIVI